MTGAGEVTEIQGSRIKLIGLCLVGLLMTATAAALAFGWLPARRAGDNSVAWGWFGLLFFGFCTAVIL
jgi:hypothetical protein